jgi:U4/U6.U5 tri-snRNP-associated protein 1
MPDAYMRAVAEEREAEAADAQNAMKEEEEVGLTIDDTSEFVQAVSLDAKPERRVMVLETVKHEASEDEDMEELEAGEVDPKMEEEMLALKMELDKQFGDEEIVKREDDGDLQVGDLFFLTINSSLWITFVGWHGCRKNAQHGISRHVEHFTF